MGILERKILEKEKRRKDILRAAKKVFFEKGFINSSMEMIAKASQLSKGTLYLYFKSKDDLYVTLLEDGLTNFLKIVTETIHKDVPPEEKLLNCAEAYYEFSIQFPEIFTIMMEANREELIHSEKVNSLTLLKVKDLEDKVINKVIEVFQSGIEADSIVACYAVSNLWVSLTGAIELCRRKNKPHIMDNVESIEIVKDITKCFIIAYSTSAEVRERFRKEIRENANKQAPTMGIYCINTSKLNK